MSTCLPDSRLYVTIIEAVVKRGYREGRRFNEAAFGEKSAEVEKKI